MHEAPEAPQRVPAPAVDAIDTTGAGDVLAGVVAAAIDRGLLLGPAQRRSAAASRKVTRRGTSSGFPTRDELAALAGVMDLP